MIPKTETGVLLVVPEQAQIDIGMAHITHSSHAIMVWCLKQFVQIWPWVLPTQLQLNLATRGMYGTYVRSALLVP